MSCSRGLKSQLQRLQRTKRGKGRLPDAKAKASIGAGSGVGYGAASSSGDQAIASPLKEDDISTREHHPAQVNYSSDGLFTMTIEPIKMIRTTDGNGNEVIIELAPPA